MMLFESIAFRIELHNVMTGLFFWKEETEARAAVALLAAAITFSWSGLDLQAELHCRHTSTCVQFMSLKTKIRSNYISFN